jgi:DNA-binding MurR/RpiR family transcriptional regulator
MKSVLIPLKQYQPSASNAECGVVSYMTEHPEESSKCSIYRLAELSYTSPSTIVRLCRKLGFSGYRELQSALIHELALRSQNTKNQSKYIDHFDSLKETIASITYRNITSLEDSMNMLDEEALAESIRILENGKNLYLFGIGSSLLVAQDALLKFIRIGKSCTCGTDTHTQYVLSSNADKTDAAIIISYSGYTEEMIRCANNLCSRGTPIIAITRYGNSPLSQLANCILHTVAVEELFRSGAMASRIAQLNVIDILYTAYLNRNYQENILKIERSQIKKMPPPSV